MFRGLKEQHRASGKRVTKWGMLCCSRFQNPAPIMFGDWREQLRGGAQQNNNVSKICHFEVLLARGRCTLPFLLVPPPHVSEALQLHQHAGPRVLATVGHHPQIKQNLRTQVQHQCFGFWATCQPFLHSQRSRILIGLILCDFLECLATHTHARAHTHQIAKLQLSRLPCSLVT